MTSENKIYWDEEDIPTYSLDETIEILKVGKTALLGLAKKGILKEIEYPIAPNSQRMFRKYTIESVDSYKDFLNQHVTMRAIAEEFNLPRTSIFNLLRNENLPYQLDEENFTRRTGYVTTEVYEQVAKILKQRNTKKLETRKKSDFYKAGYGVYQPFIFPNGKIMRLQLNQDTDLGFYNNEAENRFELVKAAIKRGAQPVYKISDRPTFNSNHYVQLKCSIYNNAIYTLIDAAYQQIGYRNMYIKAIDQELNVSVKQCVLEGIEDKISPLNDFHEIEIIGASYKWENGDLIFKSAMQVHSIYMEDSLAIAISEYAKTNQLRINDVIQKGYDLLLKETANNKSG